MRYSRIICLSGDLCGCFSYAGFLSPHFMSCYKCNPFSLMYIFRFSNIPILFTLTSYSNFPLKNLYSRCKIGWDVIWVSSSFFCSFRHKSNPTQLLVEARVQPKIIKNVSACNLALNCIALFTLFWIVMRNQGEGLSPTQLVCLICFRRLFILLIPAACACRMSGRRT